METKHTPGPWRFVWDGSEAVIIGRPTWPCVRHRVKGEWQIAVTDDLIDEHPEESEANARLIAAAPELKDALAAMLDFWGGYECPEVDEAIRVMQKLGEDRWSMQAQMDAAKAEGRS